jgi:pyruvate ferredoxin oxidoreductase beta subunit
MRQVMLAVEDELVIGNATGCLEVATTIFPYTAWDTSWIHNAFENAAATVSGVETAYKVLRKRGKVKKDKSVKFIAVGGDGGTYDIGLQSLYLLRQRGVYEYRYSTLEFDAQGGRYDDESGGGSYPGKTTTPEGPDRDYGGSPYPLRRADGAPPLAGPDDES